MPAWRNCARKVAGLFGKMLGAGPRNRFFVGGNQPQAKHAIALEKLGQGVEITHRLDCRGFFSWLGYPFLRRACSVFLRRSNAALEKHFRSTTVQSRYARPSGRRA